MRIPLARTSVAAAATLLLLLAGCTTAPTATQPSAAPSTMAPSTTSVDDSATAAFLARHQLNGLTAQQIIETLDASEDDRQAGPFGSVRPSELQLSDDQSQIVVPIPSDRFYLAFAPYRQQTHDCFNHNLATCRGELANQTLTVTIVDDTGATLIDQQVTTHANGFAGIWLPRNITGKITVTHDTDTASSTISTGPGDPTCLTTLKLS